MPRSKVKPKEPKDDAPKIHFQCANCGGTHVKVYPSNIHYLRVVCVDCHKMIKQIDMNNSTKVAELYRNLNEQYGGNMKAIKRVVKIAGNWILKCSNCGCMLYNSGAEEPVGQFNLKEAKFCPKCGCELY